MRTRTFDAKGWVERERADDLNSPPKWRSNHHYLEALLGDGGYNVCAALQKTKCDLRNPVKVRLHIEVDLPEED